MSENDLRRPFGAAAALLIGAALLPNCKDEEGAPTNPDLVVAACCLPDRNCEELPKIDCLVAGGGPVGASPTCGSDTCSQGACCFQRACVRTTAADCAYSYRGDGTTCDLDPCSLGACCVGLGSPDPSCEDTEEDYCALLEGTWLGNATSCEPDRPCGQTPTAGACCLEDGQCELSSEVECVGFAEDSYAGRGVACTPDLCKTGACCDQEGGCTETLPLGCFDRFQGRGTRCDMVSCAPVLGACCVDDGTCLDFDEQLCAEAAGGTFQGIGTNCLGTICPNLEGACCLEFDTCVEVTSEACSAQTSPLSDSFQGLAVPCTDTLCVEPEGACCVDGICLELQEVACVESAGTWIGGHTACSNPRVATMCGL